MKTFMPTAVMILQFRQKKKKKKNRSIIKVYYYFNLYYKNDGGRQVLSRLSNSRA